MHFLSSVYSVAIHLRVSGLVAAHHQKVTLYTQQFGRVVRFS
jgi:hypothetical protein